MKLQAVEARVPNCEIPILKEAANELGIDMTTGEMDGELRICYFLISDYGQLVSLGFIAGSNKTYKQLISPVHQLLDGFQEMVDKVTSKTPNE